MKRFDVVAAGALLALAATAHAERVRDRAQPTITDLGPIASESIGRDLIGQLETKWSKVLRAMGWTDASFEQFRAYARSPESVLREALDAPTLERMQSVFDSYAALATRDAMAKAFPARKSFKLNETTPDMASNEAVMQAKLAVAKSLGEDARDLTFVPITPCTVWDTRFATDPASMGIIGNAVTKTFYSHYNGAGGSFASWGGNPSCPETAQNFIGGRPFAVMMTAYVNDGTGNGWVTFYRNGDTDPSQATISVYYSPGPTRTQTVIAKSNRGYGLAGDYDIAVTGRFASAHVSASVTGYFIKNQATQLECTIPFVGGVGGAGSWANNTSLQVNFPACPAGFTRTGTGCGYDGIPPAGMYIQEHSQDFGYCYFFNASGGALANSAAEASSTCCRVPGRP